MQSVNFNCNASSTILRLAVKRYIQSLLFLTIVTTMTSTSFAQDVLKVSGELKQWHNITMTFAGPEASEDGDPNPFFDYRLNVTFVHAGTGTSYKIPGYFAADGNAANTSASSGNQWRVHLAPDHVGEWEYTVSFRNGKGVAVSNDADAGRAVAPIDGMKGTLEVGATDKQGRDFRGKGRLDYVGKHHLQFAGSKEFFLKAGVDAPENLLAYRDFDGDFKSDGQKDNLVKNWESHVQDWQEGDPTWGKGRGKGLIGAINYLASQGLNVFSFLTLNIDGDDRNVFPYTSYDERLRIDCSKMDQWEIVFSHGDKLGMYLHFKTLECENVNLLDKGQLGPQRKLYYRELIARFGHHLAMNWNLGEEVGYVNPVSTQQKVDWANFFADNDPYHHHIVIHNGNKHYDLMGNASPLTGFSLQTSQTDFRNVHGSTLNYIRRSVKAGKPWVVACDEPGDAQHSLVTDAEDPTHDNPRTNALWGNIMAGGAGVEWYFGYKHDHSDLTCQDFRVRENMWKQCRIAVDFFRDQKVPFWDMTNANKLLISKNGFCLAQEGKVYLVFAKEATETSLDLTNANGIFEVLWFNPRSGGKVQVGTVEAVNSGGKYSLGRPPADPGKDWVAIIRPAPAGASYSTFGKPAKEKPANRMTLSAVNDFKFVVSGEFVRGYKDNARKAMAINAAEHKDKFAAAESTFGGKTGTYDLVLNALTETDGESSYRLFVAGQKVGEATNPETEKDYQVAPHRFNGVALTKGDSIRVEFNSASNGKIPEGNAFAFSRGRWKSIRILKPGTNLNANTKKRATPPKQFSEFKFNYDPTQAKKVHQQREDGVLVVEAEDFDAVNREDHRKWYLTTADKEPGIQPDPDPNHAEGASNGAYIEILPDTRVTHADPLVNGVSFSNKPGQCSVLYYPVEIAKPGRYYVWVRMCCTGSEDNGIHVGLDGEWPASGQRLQFTGNHGKWQWDSRQRTEKVHTGVLGQIWLDIDKPGLHTIMFSMREDGFEFDKFMLTTDQKPMKSKSLEMGPEASPMK